MSDDMQEKLLSYPDVELNYWVSGRGMPGYVVIPEIIKGEYGYILKRGQKIHAIRYRNTNHNHEFNATVKKISDEGITIDTYGEEKFMPWLCELPNAGVFAPRTLYLQPCEFLYEMNPLADIISGNIPFEDYNRSGKASEKGKGIWYKHGGWRTISSYEENLHSFTKLGQINIFDYK